MNGFPLRIFLKIASQIVNDFHFIDCCVECVWCEINQNIFVNILLIAKHNKEQFIKNLIS